MKPAAASDSQPAEPTYFPCPGSVVGAHLPCVYLERKTCRDRAKSISVSCLVCQFRGFLRGPAWKRLVLTAKEARSQAAAYGMTAVDGRGVPL